MDTVRSWICVGDCLDARDGHKLSVQGIGAVLQLAERVEYSSINCLYVPVEDGTPLSSRHLRHGIDFVLKERDLRHKTLIACSAGVSRSVTFAVATLKEVEGITLLEALRIVKSRHEEAAPHPALWESLCTYYREELSFGAMLDIVLDH
jgi:protein-tyrosine phosphatase